MELVERSGSDSPGVGHTFVIDRTENADCMD